MKLIVIALIILTLFISVPAVSLNCDNLPDGWSHLPGLWRICLLLEQFEQCGFDPDCGGWE